MERFLPRPPRLHVPGGYYHVYARGNGKQDIFFTSNDRLRWEQLLRDGLQRYNHLLHAYCWMTNHVHVAIQAGQEPLARFIGTLLSRYAKGFNRNMGRSGHLFERRYGAKLVKDDSYLLELVRYIHQNPIRAGIVTRVSDYKWCSHHVYSGMKRQSWITTDTVLSLFGRDVRSARQQYVAFIGDKQPLSVVDEIEKSSSSDPGDREGNAWHHKVLQCAVATQFESLDELIDNVCRINNITEAELASPSRSRSNAKLRAEIAWAAMTSRLATVTQVAQRFGRSQPALSRTIGHLRKESNKL